MSLWYLPLLIVGTTVLLSIPVGLLPGLDHRRPLRRAALAALVRTRAGHRAAGLETVCRRDAALQHRHVSVRVRRAGVQPYHPAVLNPDGPRHARPDDDLQHGQLVLHQHQPAALRRRAAPVVFQPDCRSSSGTCSSRPASASAPWRPSSAGCAATPHMGNYYLDMWRIVVYVFLPASLIMGVLLMAAGVPMTLEPSAEATTLEAGAMGTDEAAAATAGHRPRTGGGRHADQAPGHQRRRLLRRQLGAPVREPQRLDQLSSNASTS